MDLLRELLARATAEGTLNPIKTGIALVVCALLFFEARGKSTRVNRAKPILAAAIGVAALTSYFFFFQSPYRSYYHRWELYHYYLGAKYVREVGYERLYTCTVIADGENGNVGEVERTFVRDLRDDSLVSAKEAWRHPEACKVWFSDARWAAFRRDVAWFREAAGGGVWWRDMRRDHGYNPPPVWALAGHALTNSIEATDAGLKLLAALDVTLLAGAVVVLAWAFGWRTGVIAVVFWATQLPSSAVWTIGAFLRQDWVFLAVLAVALVRKGYFFWAGVALGYCALLRIFPALFWVGPLCVMAADTWRARSLRPTYRRFLLGGALAFALAVPASAMVTGWKAYPEFANHIAMHAATPISNHMSLRTLFYASPDTRMAHLANPRRLDPVQPWLDARRERLRDLMGAYWITAGVLTALFVAVAVRLRTLWMSIALAPFLVVVLTDPSCYYYSIWILFAPLSRVRKPIEVALLGLAAVGQVIASRFSFVDDKYTALAAVYVAFSFIIVLLFVRTTGWKRWLTARALKR